MGCSQSDDSSVINPMNQEQLVSKQAEINKQKNAQDKASHENKQTIQQIGKNQNMIKKTQNPVANSMQKYIKREQVNEMPNDEYHVKILESAKKLVTQMKLTQAQKKADEFFQKGWIDQAIDIYQRIIAADPTYKNQIQGLGNTLLSESYFQWYFYQWYSKNKQLKKIKQSPYDALSLCYSLINPLPKYSTDIKKGQMWYKMMTTKYPQNYGLWMGYANILSMTTSFDQALKIYDKVLELKPNFLNALVCKAMLHTYKRIIPAKAIQLANKILELTGSNCYAWQILGRLNSNIDTKIQNLKKGAQKHPQYVRTINQIGICYGGTKKDYDQAIKWYKQCIQIAPSYYSCYNNIGVNLQLKKQLKQAKVWYFKAMEIQPDYGAPHNNIIDVYNQLKINDKQIQQQIILNPKIKKQICFWKLGVEFYNKKILQRSVYWLQKATLLDPNNPNIWNSYGITLDQLGQRKKAIQMYLKAVEFNPQLSSAYFNAGIAYKGLNMTDQAIQIYKKATQVNPKYSFPYNNLGNIYKNKALDNPNSKDFKDDLQQAVEYYQRAVQFNSTYTLALSNMGLCLAKLGKFKEAYNAFLRAKQALPNDNNNLSQSNKVFLKQQLEIFDKQGGKWKKTGSITDQQKQSLKNLILQFQNKFKSIAEAHKKVQASAQKMFNPQIIQIIKIINEDKFQLGKIEQIFEFVEKIFHQDQQYFHIIPLLIIQKFTNEVFHKKKAIMNVEDELRDMMKKISQIVNKKQNEVNQMDIVKNIDVKLTECVATNKTVNLFQQTSFFSNYQELYIQIAHINNLSKKSFSEFSLLVQQVRKKSNGFPGGLGTKIPIKQSQQFKVMLRIMQKMFKKQINKQRTIKIIKKIDQNLQKLQQVGLDIVVKQIMKGWTQEITQILRNRKKDGTETQFTISDLLRAKCSYNSLDGLLKAVRVCDSYCKSYGYEIIELDNRLSKPQTQDVVFKIKIGNALCQFQLAMKQNQSLYHLDHCVYEILRSPLGCIFGSYLFMSKQVKYPLTANCKDITQKLDTTDEQEKKIVKICADYVFNALNGSFKSI